VRLIFPEYFSVTFVLFILFLCFVSAFVVHSYCTIAFLQAFIAE